jgi:hypothetical protein
MCTESVLFLEHKIGAGQRKRQAPFMSKDDTTKAHMRKGTTAKE